MVEKRLLSLFLLLSLSWLLLSAGRFAAGHEAPQQQGPAVLGEAQSGYALPLNDRDVSRRQQLPMSKDQVSRPPPADPPLVAFLVRCWRDGEQWHYLLENVKTREKRGFRDGQALYQYVQKLLREAR